MNNIASTTTLWQLLGKTDIVVPILQRDYAQGRSGYENLREKFLSSILDALDNKQQLKLDFVYGSSDFSGRFNPIDGQQRLTTLWLIHWFLAFKLGKLQDESVIQRLLHFSYETRSSSTQFCNLIVRRGGELHQMDNENIADTIIRQTWFPSVWRQDPTVQAMLRMLSGELNGKVDGIEELFANASSNKLLCYWESLMMPAATCPLVFYQLDLENLGQSDDLYVKMNGRGKPLSDYENFKADLVKYMADNGWSSLLHPTQGIPILLDTKWTDFFWNYRHESIDLDDVMFGFINRYFLVRLMISVPELKLEDNELGSTPLDKAFKFLYSYTEDHDKRESYNQTGFGVYQSLFEAIGGFSSLYDLRTILNNISIFDRSQLTDCIKYMYDDSETFELVYTSGKDNLYKQTIQETIAFWAVCRFFLSPLSGCTSENLKHWMRIVWNVCNYHVIENNKSVPEIRSKSALRATIIALDKSFKSNWDVYNTTNFMNYPQSATDSDQLVMQHIFEEQEKIRKIGCGLYNGSISSLQGKTWEKIIEELEHLSIFKGTIRALIYDGNRRVDWESFDTKYSNLYWYLNNYGCLDSVAFRNLLLHNFSIIQKLHWFPKGNKQDAFWRLILERTNTHNWLLASPMDATQLSVAAVPEKSYRCKSIIQTSLLEESTHDSGMYLAYSWTYNKHVFIHHQSSSPYIIFNEDRDRVLNELLKSGLITLDNPSIHKKCGLFDARDVLFKYRGELYNWHASGTLYNQSQPNVKLPQPTSVSSFINAMIIFRLL